jgi:hypothetical protein
LLNRSGVDQHAGRIDLGKNRSAAASLVMIVRVMRT